MKLLDHPQQVVLYFFLFFSHVIKYLRRIRCRIRSKFEFRLATKLRHNPTNCNTSLLKCTIKMHKDVGKVQFFQIFLYLLNTPHICRRNMYTLKAYFISGDTTCRTVNMCTVIFKDNRSHKTCLLIDAIL